MKNDIKVNMKKLVAGFTIAELLISMLISAVLIAALVPVVGVKKVKRPADKLQHGIAECYYQGGSLRYYYQDNTNPDKNRDEVVDGDHCTFTVPASARYVQVFVIGHGGKAEFNQASYIMDNGAKYEGDIHINELFQQHIDRANTQVQGLANMIRDSLNDWASSSGLTAEFNVISPIGAGGPGMCHAQLLSTSDYCKQKCGTNDFPSDPTCPGPLENLQPPYYWSSKGAASYLLNPLLLRELDHDIDLPSVPVGPDEPEDPLNDICQVDYAPDGCNCSRNITYPPGHKCYRKTEGDRTIRPICRPDDMVTTECDCADLAYDYPEGHKCNPSHREPKVDPDLPVMERKCWAYIHGQGQSSGMGVRKTVVLPINGNSTIKVETGLQRSGVSVTTAGNEKYLYLSSSESGAAPVQDGTDYTTPNTTPAGAGCDTNIENGCSGLTNTSSNSGTPTGTILPVGRLCELHYAPENAATPGRVESNLISYSYEPAYINLTHGAGGKPGEIRVNVYEKLTGALNLYPASSYDRDSYFTKNSTNISVTTPARAGANGEMTEAKYQVSANLNPVIPEVRNIAKADNTLVFAEYLSKINSASVNGGLKGCDAAGTCPGFGGTGSYVNMKKIKSSNLLNLNYNGSHYPGLMSQKPRSFNSSCDPGDSSSSLYGISDDYVFERCYNQDRMQGNPGAVIIVW